MAHAFAQQTLIGWPASQVNWRPTRFPVQARNRRAELDSNRSGPSRNRNSQSFELSGLVNRNLSEPKAHWSILVAT